MSWIEAFFEFETKLARGRGVLRLMADGDGTWRAWNVLTAMQDLKGHERRLGEQRPIGHSPESDLETRANWLDRRLATCDFLTSEPTVLVVGAGQGGLSIAANLGLLGVDTLVIEKNQRVGDNWRKRYHSLVLHDPVWADHLAHLPFPESWPIYTPKDKLGDWFEHYAATMELNVWTSTELLDSSYDDDSGRWTVRVRRGNGTERTLHPTHVILATGALGEPNVPHFEGEGDFRGTLQHSSQFSDGSAWSGRKAIVVGACNSGHDIAQEFHEQGADTTIVQRSSTYIMSQANGIPILFGSLYYEGGPELEDADLLNAAYPFHVVLQFAKAQTEAIGELDQDLLERLAGAGFKLDTGIDGGGLMSKALSRGGGYYIDVGCSRLIAAGEIKVKNAAIDRFTQSGIRFTDGTELDADIVVLATGYANMRETARRLFGEDVGNRVKDVWDLDEEGEINTLWRDSGHPGFWFMGGPLVMARIYAPFLALQIKALSEGLTSHPSAS
jgi:putative flavoprotein involved in K+ transport